MLIEPVIPAEYPATQELVRRAFLGAGHTDGDEYQLIGRLRKEDEYHPEFDVVAKLPDGTIAGHAMLSPIRIVNGQVHHAALALAPLAVAPEYQHQGIGGQLIQYLEHAATSAQWHAISILGDPAYYGRFGYVPASDFGIHAGFDVPAEYYMLKELTPGALADVRGVVQYQASFGI